MTELELRAHRIEAVGAIENLMSLHAYYHAADQNREELLNCWSKPVAPRSSGARTLVAGRVCTS